MSRGYDTAWRPKLVSPPLGKINALYYKIVSRSFILSKFQLRMLFNFGSEKDPFYLFVRFVVAVKLCVAFVTENDTS